MTWSRMSSYAALVVVAIVVMGVISATQQATETPRHAYILVQADISNPERYAEYAKLAPDIVTKYGGRYLARAGRTLTLEGPPARSRVVVIEFPSLDAAQRFYNSPEYTAARKLREGSATAQFVVVEAL